MSYILEKSFVGLGARRTVGGVEFVRSAAAPNHMGLFKTDNPDLVEQLLKHPTVRLSPISDPFPPPASEKIQLKSFKQDKRRIAD